MQLNLSRKLIRMFVEKILDEVLPNETGAARLQQVGLFTLIYMLQDDKEPVTVSRLMVMTGQSDSQIIRHVKKMIALELIERTQILNRQGRGRAYQLSIKHNEKTKRLAKAIHNASARPKG